MKFFKDELKKIRAFVFDVDGVLSHQSQNLTPDGELIRTSCTKDGYHCRYFGRWGTGRTRTFGEIRSQTGGYLSQSR